MCGKIETFDVVDEADRIIGQASRKQVHERKLLHRAVHVFIQSGPDHWLLQRRSDQKDIDPLLWTTSCSGHVDSGEGYLESAVRECKEELGLDLSPIRIQEVFRCSACSETGDEFVRVYLCRSTEKIYPNPDEICDTKELQIDEIESELSDQSQSYSLSFRHLFPFARKAMARYMSSS
jgi:isopentenyl-diphosphate delta-isomerase type 1